MTAPTASVVIPTFNRSRGLRRALASVLAQSFVDFEALVVDDASTDGTPDLVASFTDPRVRYQRQPINVGVARNWGTGLSLARGEFVALLMDDDWYGPEFLAHRVVALRSEPSALFAFAGYTSVDEVTGERRPSGPLDTKDRVIRGPALLEAVLAKTCFVGATLYRTAALRAVWPSAEAHGIVVDFAANLRLALGPDAAAVIVGGAEMFMSRHAGQVSRSRTDEVHCATYDLLTGILAEPLPGPFRRLVKAEAASWQVQRGRTAAASGDRRRAIRYLADAARLCPTSRAPWTQLARVLTGLPVHVGP
jgi:glycosyltransferase involved in cell wall biosynthesis